MFRITDRLSLFLALGAVVTGLAACAENATAPGPGLSVRNDVILTPAYIIDTGPGGTASVGSSAMFAAGATNCSPQPACAAHFQFLGGQFSLRRGANVTSVEGWMSVGFAGTLKVAIRADSAPAVGAHIPGRSLDSATYSVASQAYGWKAFSDFDLDLSAGNYWVTFEPVANGGFSGGMAGPSASPLPAYAYFADGNNRWLAFTQNPGFGFRVFGATVLTPSDQIEDLEAYVSGLGLSKPHPSKINGLLGKALNALAADQAATACGYLQDVVAYINKQGPRKIAPADATDLVSRTNAISDDIGC
jgi:hypothetical protein